jgi:predicted AAA+ superfamily ATPase
VSERQPTALAGRIANYRKRVADAELAARLRATGAVLIEGPRGCGKTQTALRPAASAVRLDRDQASREAGLLDPDLLLPGAQPRLIDEWQLVPQVWNAVRGEVDDHPQTPGQFILTGSAVPSDDATRHTGAMRFTRLRMRPMSLSESGHSSGAVSLAGLFAGEVPRATDPGLRIGDLAERVCVGGWPALLGRDPVDALFATVGYLDETRRTDLVRLDGVRRDPENVARVLQSVARNVSTEASARSIAADVSGTDRQVNPHTVLEYLDALSRLFVVEDQPAWAPALRSRGILRSAPKRQFADPSLAAAALGATPDRLLADPKTLGLLFESLVIRDLRIYAQPIGGVIHHYRENTGLEADMIVALRDGRWAALEVKLGQHQVDQAAASLLRVAAHIDPAQHAGPAFLAVVTGWGFAYRREDGVFVLPIGTLAA